MVASFQAEIMNFALKVMLALAVAALLPAIILFIAFGRWSQDNFDLSIPALVYLVPLLLVALGVRRFFRAPKVAAGIYSAGMSMLLIFAVTTLWSELHGPVFGRVYIPTIILSFPFGLVAILHHTAKERNHA